MNYMKQESKLAVLIDGDNVPSKYIKEMMEEITKYGTPTIKRIYGDWTKPYLSKWKTILLENAINPIQQYAYTTGKNATDSAMIIDAMDILYSEKVNGFCLVSSDSDFTKLATRLREAGAVVYGIGEKKTPNPFIVACDKFIYLEILETEEDPKDGKRKHKKHFNILYNDLNIPQQTIITCLDKTGAPFDPTKFGTLVLTFEADSSV